MKKMKKKMFGLAKPKRTKSPKSAKENVMGAKPLFKVPAIKKPKMKIEV